MTPKKAKVNPQAESEFLAPHEEVVETKPVDASLPDAPKVVKEVKPTTCGHINRQHFNSKGKLEGLPCTLPEGHSGDHSAKYMRNVPDPVTNEKGIVVSVAYHEEEAETYWSNAAGKTAQETVEGTQEQMSLLQKDLVMDILKRDPRMTAQEAIERAKASPAWNAAALS